MSARAHQSLIWDRTRHVLRLRSALRDFFPAALAAFDELDAPETLGLLAQAPDPDTASRLSKANIVRALTAAGRRDVPARAETIRMVLTAPEVRQPGPVQEAYAAIVTTEVALITVLNTQIERLGQVVGEHFGRHRDADIYTSLPGLGVILGARILGEFGDDPHRYTDARHALRPTPYYDGPLATLDELYVAPQVRDRGHGTELVHAIVDELRRQGCGEVHINVDEEDVDTRRFYESHGFVNQEPGTDERMLCYIQEL